LSAFVEMPVPTTEIVTPLRESSMLNVSSLSVREEFGVTALPRMTPLIDARPEDTDEGPTDDTPAFPPHAAAMRPTTANTTVPAAERIRCIRFLQVSQSAPVS
jgi:hypothetical protein